MEQYVGDNIYSKNEATAEALLFASGGVVEPESICLVLKVKKDEAEEVMKRLMARYERRKGGIIIRKVGDGWQLSSNPDYYDDLCVYFQETATGNLSSHGFSVTANSGCLIKSNLIAAESFAAPSLPTVCVH